MKTLSIVRLFLFLVSSLISCTYANEPALVVGNSTSLQIIPGSPVTNSPGSKSGSIVVAERVHIYGLSRMKNLEKFSHSLKVKVSRLNESLVQPNVEVCFHRNTSLGIGMCPQAQWEKLSKGSWVRTMSPFDHKLLDIRVAGSSLEALEVSLEEEFFVYRIVFLVLGTVMIMSASVLSESLVFYYSSAMALGIILVILMVLFQGMKLLPTGRKSSLAIFLYSSLVGVGSFLLRYLSGLLRTVLAEIGLSEDTYNPLVIFVVLFISLAGAWLGFWVVRKLVLTEDGSIDASVAQFVAWSIRIFAAVMILQCSLDPLLATGALICAILLSSMLRRAVRPRLVGRLYRKLNKVSETRNQKSKNYDSPSPDDAYFRHTSDFQFSQDRFRSPLSRRSAPVCSNSLSRGRSNTQPSPLSESQTFYSTYHKTPEQKKFSNDEWKLFTDECTKKGLKELVSSPEFSKWAVAHADRLTLTPATTRGSSPGSWWQRWWFSRSR